MSAEIAALADLKPEEFDAAMRDNARRAKELDRRLARELES